MKWIAAVSFRTPTSRKRLMRILSYLLFFICLMPGITICAENTPDDLQPVTMQLKWFHQFQFAGYYAALHKGFYRDEGLDVKIKSGGPHIRVDEEVLSGRADFGVLASELIQMRTSGKPLVLLAVIMQHSTRAIIVRTDSGIFGPADLVGKHLMINLNEDSEFKAMFLSEGISYEKLSITPKDETANSKFIEGKIDGLNGSIGNQPFIFNQSNIEVKTIRPISYGIDFYGDSLFTSEMQIKENPEQAEKFREATLRGWYYAMANVEEIVDLIIAEYAPGSSREHLQFEAEALQRLILPDLIDIGHVSPRRIERIAQIYSDLGLVPDNYSLEGFLYNPTEGDGYDFRVIFILSVALSVAAILGAILFLFNSRLKKLVAERTEELLQSNTSLVQEMETKKIREAQLRESNALLKAIIEGTTDAIFLKNLKGQYLLANSSALEAIGRSEEEVISKDDSELFPAESAVKLNDVDLSVLQSGQPKITEERFESAYGDSFWLTNKSPYRDAEGNIIGLIGISRNITKLKQVEKEKEALRERLVQAQKMESIGTLAGGIAHDFNNILAAILGYAELALEDSPVGSLAARDLEEVIRAGNRAKELVKQILAFSRQAEYEQIMFQPAAIVKETIKLLRSSLPTTITIEQDIEKESGLILADPTQIHQIVMNLCTNAFHAMEKEGGTLSVSLKKKSFSQQDLVNFPDAQPGDFVQISIRDSGAGINPEVQGRIFDPYFTTKVTGKGTGLGLAIVHGIVKSYAGFITCHSQVGEGTVFQINLPVLNEQQLHETKPNELIPVGTERILFVDDEKILVELGQAMLERLGYSVTARTSSLEALTTFQNQPDAFDLVITDQTMPGMTGIDLARRMLQIRPQLPIIICTGFSAIISEEDVRSIGVKGYALKPLAKRDIAALIRKVLEEVRLTS